MTAFRPVLAILWLAVAAATLRALLTLGTVAAPATFLADFAHPWRAQFYLDLESHLVLFAAWLLWRERWKPAAFAGAIATLLLGALFTLPYLLAAWQRSGGDVRRLLIGSRT